MLAQHGCRAESRVNQHAKVLERCKVAPFDLYVMRHTCLTRWAKHMDPFALHKVAGHKDIKTTMRYVHPSDEHIREAISKARSEPTGHTSGHTEETAQSNHTAKPQ